MKVLNMSSPILNRYAVVKSNGQIKPVCCFAKTKKEAIKVFRENKIKAYWANVTPVKQYKYD